MAMSWVCFRIRERRTQLSAPKRPWRWSALLNGPPPLGAVTPRLFGPVAPPGSSGPLAGDGDGCRNAQNLR